MVSLVPPFNPLTDCDESVRGLFVFLDKRRLVIMGPKGWHHDCGTDGGFYSDSETLFLQHLETCEVRVTTMNPEAVSRWLEEMRLKVGYGER